MQTSRTVQLHFILAMLLACAGCAGGGSVQSWQQNVEQYVHRQGNGDPAILRDVTLSDGRRGFSTLGGAMPAQSSDVNGVLIARQDANGRTWTIYLVGVVRDQKVAEIKPVAFAMNGSKFDWSVGKSNPEAVRVREKAGRGFPQQADQFSCAVAGNVITVSDANSPARWQLNLPANR